MDDLTVIVLAAGGGTRMKSKTAKVLHPIAGLSMVGHVLRAVRSLEPATVVAVVGHQREQVAPHIEAELPGVVVAVQESQEGTGHAVRIAWEALPEERRRGTVLVAYGDTPLLEGPSLSAFLDHHATSGDAISILSGRVSDPFGYGRVIRDADGDVNAIVEQKEATPEQAAVDEINSGILAFEGDFLAQALGRLDNDNAQKEYYLTDTVAIARKVGRNVGAFELADVLQTEGANDRIQLAKLAAEKNRRILEGWMREGVTIIDPATTWVDVDVTLAADVTLLPGVQLLGTTAVEEDAVIGPDCTLKDCEIGAGAKIVRAHGELAVIGEGADIGPFSYLRPGTQLGAGGKIGAFVETKNAQIGNGAKVPHLSYVGDAEIGEGSNIGAGAIFANYDGVNKNRSKVGRHVKTGVHNSFVAPVVLGDGAATGAGAVIRSDVPPGALAVSSPPQRHYDEWAQRRRAGTPQAEAAQAASACENQAGPGSGPGSGTEVGTDDGSARADQREE